MTRPTGPTYIKVRNREIRIYRRLDWLFLRLGFGLVTYHDDA